MKSYDVYAIVQRLIGPVCGAGDSYVDIIRYENLEDTIELVDRLIYDISRAAADKNSQEGSVYKIGNRANRFLKELKESLEDG